MKRYTEYPVRYKHPTIFDSIEDETEWLVAQGYSYVKCRLSAIDVRLRLYVYIFGRFVRDPRMIDILCLQRALKILSTQRTEVVH